MDVVLFALALVALAAFVAAPLYSHALRSPPDERVEWKAHREDLIRCLADLEVDRASGLIDQTQFEDERSVLEAQAAQLSARLDRD